MNLFSLTFKLSQGNKISSDHWNNIVVKSSDGNIALDCQIKTHDCWVTEVKFLETNQDRVQSATAICFNNTNDFHVELGHPSETITYATANDMGIQVNGSFKPHEDCAFGKTKKSRVSKKTVACSKNLGGRLFSDISSPSTPTFGGKKHWLLVMEDSRDYAWSFFLKEKLDLAVIMLGLIKNLKISIICRYNTYTVTSQVKMFSSKKPTNRKSWGWTLNILPHISHNKMAVSNKNLLAMLNSGQFNAFL